jgi:hypothetical protein
MNMRLLAAAPALAFAAAAHADLHEFSQAGTLKVDAGAPRSATLHAACSPDKDGGALSIELIVLEANTLKDFDYDDFEGPDAAAGQGAESSGLDDRIGYDGNLQHRRGLVCAGAAAILHVRRQPAFASARSAGETAGRDRLGIRETRMDANRIRQGNAQTRRNVRLRRGSRDAAAQRCRGVSAGRQVRLTKAAPDRSDFRLDCRSRVLEQSAHVGRQRPVRRVLFGLGFA